VELLERDAAQVDASSVIPESHFAALADAGLYGSIVPPSAGGLGLEMANITALVEELSAACLATTFVLIQHFRLQALMLDPATPEHLRALLPRVVRGEIKGGISLGGSLPSPAKLLAAHADGAWRLNGEAMWVSGWGDVDQLVLTARGSDDTVHTFVVEAKERRGLTARPLTLSAMNASRTVRLAFDEVTLGDDTYVGSHPYSPGSEGVEGLRTNGSLALGVARRCLSTGRSSLLNDELQRCRDELDRATISSMPDARARACELALRSAHYLAVTRGSSSALVGDVAERSSREAALLLVFGSRPRIKESLLRRMESF
jgi:alkylation response protein AidB-like acyl-CoA dehydrogenase